MNDYVTRAEFEELKEMLMCRGDGQSIEVDSTPGGQIIRSVGIISNEPEEAAEKNYVTVLYDEDTKRFTVKVTDLTIQAIHDKILTSSENLRHVGAPYLKSESFTFSFFTGSRSLSLVLTTPKTNLQVSDDNSACIQWYPIGDPIDGYDNNTQTKKTSSPQSGIIIGSVDLNDDGTYTIYKNITPTPTLMGHALNLPQIVVDTSARRIYLRNAEDGVGLGFDIANNGLIYTEPASISLILGFNESDYRLTLDEATKTSDYDKWQDIGAVSIDSDNVVISAETYQPHLNIVGMNFWGKTTNITIDSKTLSFRNGRLTKVV